MDKLKMGNYDEDRASSLLSMINIDYEEAIAATGYGLYHRLLLFVCGSITANEAMHIVCVSFLLPAAECELNMSTEQKGWLNAAIFLGMMIGSYFWGAISDVYGRRKILITTLIISGFFGIAMSFMQTYASLLIAIVMTGFGAGGCIAVVWAYFTEFQQRHYRSIMLSYLSTFWMIGNVLVAFLGFLIVPSGIGFQSEHFNYTSWRIFVAICALPNFLSAFIIFFFPESPKFLLMTGNKKEAIQVFAIMMKLNNPPITGPLGMLLLILIQMREDNPNFDKSLQISWLCSLRNDLASIGPAFQQIATKSRMLLTSRLRRVFAAIMFIRFTLAFGYFGLWLWLPELFKRMENQNRETGYNKAVTLCDMVSQKNVEDHDHCDHPLDKNMFIDEMIVAACNFPGHVITIVFVDHIGRRLFMFTGMLLSGLSVFTVWIVTSKFSCLMLASLFGTLTVLCHSAIGVLAMEFFPTEVRGTAWGICQMTARAGAITGNILFGLLVDQVCSVPVLMVAGMLITGGLFAFLLPDTCRMPLL